MHAEIDMIIKDSCIKDVKYCRSIFSLMRGLIFSKKRVLLMEFPEEEIIRLHNFFVFFTLNLYFLDHDRRVVEIRKRFRPFTFYSSRSKARYLIESPWEFGLDIGDKVDFKR